MLFQFASFRSQIASPTLSSVAGGNTLTSRNFYYYLQLQNRSGLNLLSDRIQLSVPGGNKLVWTIPDGTIASGEEVFWYVLSASETADDTTAFTLAKIQARDADQVTARSLPLSLELTDEEHFALDSTVADVATLPVNPVNGIMRFVTSENRYYFYDSEAVLVGDTIYSYGVAVEGVTVATGAWVASNQPASTYLTSTTSNSTVKGCDRLLRASESALTIPVKTGQNSIPLRIWASNGYFPDGFSPAIIGSRFSLLVRVSGVDRSALFADKILVTCRGEIDRATGEIDTTIAGINEQFVWHPDTNLIELREELDRGKAIAYDLVLNFDNEVFSGVIPSGAAIALDMYSVPVTLSGTSGVATALGDGVQGTGDKLLVVPDKMLTGKATIEPSYTISTSVEQPLTGLSPDTGDRLAIIDGAVNGHLEVVSATAEISASQRLRAIVSTEAGIAPLVAASQLTLSSGDLVTLTITHPLDPTNLTGTIRADYPDYLIAGNSKANFTPAYFYIFLDLDGTVYQSPFFNITYTVTQDVTLSDFGALNAIAALPAIDSDFGLFAPNSVFAVNSSGGNFPTGNATFYVAYYYPSPNYNLTGIDNQPTGGIPTATTSVYQFLSESLNRNNNLADVSDSNLARQNIGAGAQTDVLANTHTSYQLINLSERNTLGATDPTDNTLAIVDDVDGMGNGATFIWNKALGDWIRLKGASGALLATQNLSDLHSIATARTNLGLGSAALLNSGTNPGEVLVLDGAGALPVIDGSNLINITATPNLTVQNGSTSIASPTVFTLDGLTLTDNGSGEAIISALPIPDPQDAVLYLVGNEFKDLSAREHAIAPTGVSIDNNSFYFTVSSLLVLADSDSWNFGSANFRFEAELKLDSTDPATQKFFFRQQASPTELTLAMGFWTVGLNIAFFGAGVQFSGALPDNDFVSSFQKFAVERVGSTINLLYKNSIVATQNVGSTAIVDGSEEFKIGREINGYLRNIKVYNENIPPLSSDANGISISDGTNSFPDIGAIAFSGAEVNESNGVANITIDSLTVRDGTTLISQAKTLNFSGAVVTDNGSGEALISIAGGGGSVYAPISQSLFIAADNTDLTAYSPEVGDSPWQNIKIVSTANTPNNTIVNDLLTIAELNTGAIIDLGDRDTIIELDWLVETGLNLSAIMRYESEGNTMLVEFTTTNITLKSVINDSVSAIAYAPYSFSVGTNYKLEIRAIGVIYEVLVNDVLAFRQFSSLFLEATLFGVGKSDGADRGMGLLGQ